MRIHFVNRFYWPAEPATAQLLHDLAESLASRGLQVSVVTARGGAGVAAHEVHHGVEIHRVGAPPSRSAHLAYRALDFARFHVAALRLLPRIVAPQDVIVALTDPPLIGVTVARVARLRGARAVHWVHDIYPEVAEAVAGNAVARRAVAMLRPLRNTAWRRAAACITLGQDMAEVVLHTGVPAARVKVIANWAPQGLSPADPDAIEALRERWNLGRRFVVGYSGNLGRVHDLGGLLEVADALKSQPNLVFLFIGHGAGFAGLEREVAARKLANVRFVPAQPRAELAATLGVPDLHVVSLREGCERFVYPSKLYGIAAVGRPVLALAAPDAEISRIVVQHQLGVTHRPGDAPAIAASLRTIMDSTDWQRTRGAAALEFHAKSGGLARATDAWEAVLSNASGVVDPAAPRFQPAP